MKPWLWGAPSVGGNLGRTWLHRGGSEQRDSKSQPSSNVDSFLQSQLWLPSFVERGKSGGFEHSLLRWVCSSRNDYVESLMCCDSRRIQSRNSSLPCRAFAGVILSEMMQHLPELRWRGRKVAEWGDAGCRCPGPLRKQSQNFGSRVADTSSAPTLTLISRSYSNVTMSSTVNFKTF
jgi:hypothetical protein